MVTKSRVTHFTNPPIYRAQAVRKITSYSGRCWIHGSSEATLWQTQTHYTTKHVMCNMTWSGTRHVTITWCAMVLVLNTWCVEASSHTCTSVQNLRYYHVEPRKEYDISNVNWSILTEHPLTRPWSSQYYNTVGCTNFWFTATRGATAYYLHCCVSGCFVTMQALILHLSCSYWNSTWHCPMCWTRAHMCELSSSCQITLHMLCFVV